MNLDLDGRCKEADVAEDVFETTTHGWGFYEAILRQREASVRFALGIQEMQDLTERITQQASEQGEEHTNGRTNDLPADAPCG